MRQRAARQPKPPTFPAEQMVFAAWLQQRLKDRRLTGAELAERAGISKASTYFYLDGSRIPGPDAVERICAAIKLDPTSVPSFTRRPVGRPAHKGQQMESTDVR
jgi:transcriptional regulator with XRE-family HTH domain